MKVVYELKGHKQILTCPDNLKDKYGHPDFLAIREHLKSKGMNNKGRLKIAA